MRFIKDCEKVLGKPIEIMKSPYGCVENVIREKRYINGCHYAPCTMELKKKIRLQWEQGKKDLCYVWGFDCNETNRAERMVKSFPEYKHEFPLIENGLTKEDAHGILERLGIRRPEMYDLGYSNNNCIGCVKGGMGYWNKIRKDFPEVFERRAKLEREIGASCIKGVFLDELEEGRGRTDEINAECSLLCEIALEKEGENK